MRIEDCLAYARLQGLDITMRELKKLFWPDSSEFARNVNMSNLLNGKTNRIDPEWIRILIDRCGVDANFIFDNKPIKNESKINS